MMKSLMKNLFLLVFVGYSLGDVQKRVYVGPGNVPQGQGLHHVVVFRRPNFFFNGLFCGGSLINDIWVLTAAHCDRWFIRVAVNPTPNANQQRRIARKHKCCEHEHHDLMLLRLENNFNGQLTPINLPLRPCAAPTLGQAVTFYGWMNARLNPAVAPPGAPQEMIPYIDNSLRRATAAVVLCPPGIIPPPNWFQRIFGNPMLPGYHICTFQHDVSTNKGDSGGSLVWNGVLHGLLSVGSRILNNNPQSLFMDICNQDYRDWIYQISNL